MANKKIIFDVTEETFDSLECLRIEMGLESKANLLIKALSLLAVVNKLKDEKTNVVTIGNAKISVDVVIDAPVFKCLSKDGKSRPVDLPIQLVKKMESVSINDSEMTTSQKITKLVEIGLLHVEAKKLKETERTEYLKAIDEFIDLK